MPVSFVQKSLEVKRIATQCRVLAGWDQMALEDRAQLIFAEVRGDLLQIAVGWLIADRPVCDPIYETAIEDGVLAFQWRTVLLEEPGRDDVMVLDPKLWIAQQLGCEPVPGVEVTRTTA